MKQRPLTHIFRFLRPYWVQELLLLGLLILITASGLASPYFLKIIIDEVLPAGDFRWLLALLTALAGIYILRGILGFASDYLSTWLGNKVIFDIKTTLFDNLLHLPMRHFETTNTGETIQQINNEVDKIQYFLTTSIIRLLNSSLSLIGLVAMLCVLDYELFLASVLFIPLSIISNRKLGSRIRENVESISKGEAGLYNFYYDRIRNIKLVKTYNSYAKELIDVKSHLQKLFHLYRRNTKLTSASRNISLFLISCGPLIVLGYGGYQVMAKTLTIGALVAFIQYLNRVYSPATELLGLYVDYVKAVESVKRIMPVLNARQKTNSFSTPPSRIYSVELQGVSFSTAERSLLKDINLQFEKGKRYAIVGPTGCGKSTLTKLLCGLYEPQAGKIIINGNQQLAALDKYQWMDKVAIVMQDHCILCDTIGNNLRYGDGSATDKDLWQSLELSNLAEQVLKMPRGLETVIGDGDHSVLPSGGQMQQIALSRVFLKNTEIIILDESTSSLDSENERKIIDNIIRIFSDRIMVVISHRLSTVMNFDEIIYMENGRVMECGPHIMLAGLKKRYYTLFRDQMIETNNYVHKTSLNQTT